MESSAPPQRRAAEQARPALQYGKAGNVAGLSVDDGQARLPLPSLIQMMHDAVRDDDIPMQSAVVEKAEYVVQSSPDHMLLECCFNVTVLSQEWASVKLLPARIACVSTKVARISSTNDEETPARVSVRNGAFVFLAHGSGEYKVSITAKAEYISERVRGIKINIPPAVINSLTFQNVSDDVDISVDPCTSQRESKEAGATNLLCDFPPTEVLTIHINSKQEEEQGEEEDEVVAQEDEIVSVEQLSLYGVGEGVVRGRSQFNYTIVHGSRSSFEICLPEGVRILHVEGPHIKRWDVIGSRAGATVGSVDSFAMVDGPASRTSSLASVPNQGRILKVWLEFATDSSYSFFVNSELEMTATSAHVSLPSFACRSVNRDKGHVAVEARTNVEIRQLKISGVARVDPRELPSMLQKQATHPILHSYKFLAAGSTEISLDVEKHRDVAVLIATTDSAWLSVTRADSKLLYRMILRVRNTQKQFLRVSTPKNAHVWSTAVAGRAVKPAIDGEGRTMIPLDKSSGEDSAFSVELVYAVEMEAELRGHGRLSFSVPSIDMPISVLYVSAYLPRGFHYGEFRGRLKEVSVFEGALPDASSSSSMRRLRVSAKAKTNFMPQQQMQQQMQQQQVQRQVLTNVCDSDSEEEDAEDGACVGVLPVRVEVPTTGKEFMFQRLLVDNEEYEMSVEFVELSKPFFQRRFLAWRHLRTIALASPAVLAALAVKYFMG